MPSSFLTYCKNSISQEESLFHQASLRFFQGERLDRKEIELLLQELLSQKMNSIQEYVLFLKKSLSLIFLTRKEESLLSRGHSQEIIKKICTHGFSQNFPFIQALQDLIFFFLKKTREFSSPKLLSKGSVLMESICSEKEGKLPDLERGALLSLFWLLLGQLSEKKEWTQAAVHLGFWYLKIIDENFFPFVGLWKEEFHFKEKDLIASLYLMFDAISSFSNHKQMLLAKDRLLEMFHGVGGELSVPYFYLLLGHELNRCKEQETQQYTEKERKEKIWLDPDLLLACYSGNHLESAFTLLGNRSTIGALHVGDVQIRSLGPQWFPIGDPTRFGIVRFPFAKSSLGDFEWKKKENGYALRGWAALASFNQETSSCWMEVKNSIENDRVFLEFNFHGEFKEKLSFVFYVMAKTVSVEGQLEMRQESLQRYEGAIRKVSFKGKTAVCSVRCQNLSCMHIIPLGANQAFWQSNFLLAYEIPDPSQTFSFLIERV